MESLTKDELLQYLDRAIALESSIYGQSQIIDEYNAAMEKCKPPAFVKKEAMLTPEPEMPDFLTAAVVGMILIPVGLMVWANGAPAAVYVVLISIGTLPFVIGGRIYRSWRKECEMISARNHTYVARINEQNKRREQESRDAAYLWQHSLEEGRAQLNRPLQETTEILNELYSSGYIYPKYRNLPALTSIYEYLVTGRCDELSGPHGAYNLYEDEVRKDTIISKLSDVVANLEKIRGNQYMLYECIRDIQDSTRAAVEELRQIRGYSFAITELTALNAYYNGVTALHHNILAVYRRP